MNTHLEAPDPRATEPTFGAADRSVSTHDGRRVTGRTGLAEHAGGVPPVFPQGTRSRAGSRWPPGWAKPWDLLTSWRYRRDELDYLRGLRGNDDLPLFDAGFLEHLAGWEGRFSCDVDAAPEGTVVFAGEPILRVTGPLWQAQLLETHLLNCLNFQSLVATKAARVCLAAGDDPVLEFGLRRAQGPDGALAASRAAFVGGVTATSNVLGGNALRHPRARHARAQLGDGVRGRGGGLSTPTRTRCPTTLSFSWTPTTRWKACATRSPSGRGCGRAGYKLGGIRLDSGDLAYLSIEARKILDAGGCADTAILATNDLDEHLITSLKAQGARIDFWAVGTRLVTAYDQPALGGVYKLGAIRRDASEPWQPRLKLSEQTAKISTPGVLAARRFRVNGLFAADMIYDESQPLRDDHLIVDPADPLRRKRLPDGAEAAELLVPIFRAGRPVYPVPPLAESRERTRAQLASLHPSIRRLLNPHSYPVGLEPGLHEMRHRLIAQAKGSKGS